MMYGKNVIGILWKKERIFLMGLILYKQVDLIDKEIYFYM